MYKEGQLGGRSQDPVFSSLLKIPFIGDSQPLVDMLARFFYGQTVTIDGEEHEIPSPAVSDDFLNRIHELGMGRQVSEFTKGAKGVSESLRRNLAYQFARKRQGMSRKEAEEASRNPVSLARILTSVYTFITGADQAVSRMENHVRQKGAMAENVLREDLPAAVAFYEALARESLLGEGEGQYYGMTPADIVDGYLEAYDRGELNEVLEDFKNRSPGRRDTDTLRRNMREKVKDDFQFYSLMKGTGLMTGTPSQIMDGLSQMFDGDPFEQYGKERTREMFQEMAATGKAVGMNLENIGEIIGESIRHGARNMPEAIARGHMHILAEKGRTGMEGIPDRREYAESLQKAFSANRAQLEEMAGAYGIAVDELGMGSNEARRKLQSALKGSGGDYAQLRRNLSRELGVSTRSIENAGRRPEYTAYLTTGPVLDLGLQTMRETAAGRARDIFGDRDLAELARQGTLTPQRIHQYYDQKIQEGASRNTVERQRSRALRKLDTMRVRGDLWQVASPAGTREQYSDMWQSRRQTGSTMDQVLDQMGEVPSSARGMKSMLGGDPPVIETMDLKRRE